MPPPALPPGPLPVPPRFLAQWGLPALVVAAFDREQVRLEAHGREDPEARTPARPDRRFPWASVTKTFTAALCLTPEVRPCLDRPLRDAMPTFRHPDPDATRHLTARDLLCHRSGLAPHPDTWIRTPLDRAGWIRQVLPTLPSAGPFRERHRYSNIGYLLLGQWLEAVTGHTWEHLLRERILGPLALQTTGVLEEHWETECPVPCRLRDGLPERMPPFHARAGHPVAPASEMVGAVADLAAWGQAQLGLPPDDERWRPEMPVTRTRPFREFGPLHYGLGWRLDTVRGHRRVWHSGQCSGFSALLSLYPDTGVGLAACTNLQGSVNALHALELRSLHRNQTV